MAIARVPGNPITRNPKKAAGGCADYRIRLNQRDLWRRDLDRKVLRLARHDAEVCRFMTAPGVGPTTALCFKATIDDPTRFKCDVFAVDPSSNVRLVGPYLGIFRGMRLQPSVKWHRSARSMLVYRSLLSPCADELDGSQIGNLMELCDTTAPSIFLRAGCGRLHPRRYSS
jgi:hypothetical protein